MEVMIVTILISIIVAFALPNFTRAVQRGRVRDAITQLSAIYAANMIYNAQNTQYVPGNFSGATAIASINSSLGINIVANGLNYTYVADNTSNPKTFSSTASWGGSSPFSVQINQNAINMPQTGTGGNPCCSSGTCVGLNAC